MDIVYVQPKAEEGGEGVLRTITKSSSSEDKDSGEVDIVQFVYNGIN